MRIGILESMKKKVSEKKELKQPTNSPKVGGNPAKNLQPFAGAMRSGRCLNPNAVKKARAAAPGILKAKVERKKLRNERRQGVANGN